MWRKKIFWILLLILFGFLIITYITGSLKPKSLFSDIVFSKIPRMDTDTLFQKLQTGAPLVIVDVRSQADFEKGHIKGAISMPFDQLETRYSTLKSGKEIILY